MKAWRDPFARLEVIAELVPTTGDCDWCGSKRKTNKLYEFRVEHDGGRIEHIKGEFCSKSCFDSYHVN